VNTCVPCIRVTTISLVSSICNAHTLRQLEEANLLCCREFETGVGIWQIHPFILHSIFISNQTPSFLEQCQVPKMR
jgi:hypothetical protein